MRPDHAYMCVEYQHGPALGSVVLQGNVAFCPKCGSDDLTFQDQRRAQPGMAIPFRINRLARSQAMVGGLARPIVSWQCRDCGACGD